MSITKRVMATTPDRVWAVLADGWLYPLWVVGASRMREVDDGWPAVGTRLHHSVGAWPLLIDDDTEVLDVRARPRARAAGARLADRRGGRADPAHRGRRRAPR